MIIYKDSIANFHRDVFQGVIANKLEELFLEHNIGRESRGEYRSSFIYFKIFKYQ